MVTFTRNPSTGEAKAPKAHWPVGLAENGSARFHERSRLRKIKIEEDVQQ